MKRIVAGLVLAAYPSVATADLKHLPIWQRQGDAACYDFAGAKKLLEADDAFDTCLKQNVDLNTALSAKDEQIKDLTKANFLAQTQLSAEKVNSQTLATNLKKCNEDQAKAASETSWGWTVAAGTGLVLGGVLLGWYVIKKN